MRLHGFVVGGGRAGKANKTTSRRNVPEDLRAGARVGRGVLSLYVEKRTNSCCAVVVLVGEERLRPTEWLMVLRIIRRRVVKDAG